MIWCLEEDNRIMEIEIYTLKSNGFNVAGFSDVAYFKDALKYNLPNLIIINTLLSGISGIDVLQDLKCTEVTKDIPVIMTGLMNSEHDKIKCLDSGADDYLIKPFGMVELVSRVKAVLRRCDIDSEQNILRFEQLSLDIKTRDVYIKSQNISLTYKEFEILKLFLAHPNIAFSRKELMEKIWDSDNFIETRTVDVHVRTLRQKLGSYGRIIGTVRNIGYKLKKDINI